MRATFLVCFLLIGCTRLARVEYVPNHLDATSGARLRLCKVMEVDLQSGARQDLDTGETSPVVQVGSTIHGDKIRIGGRVDVTVPEVHVSGIVNIEVEF